ncbi:TPA: 50S ribosomal protein L15e [Candidatus Woesearchaeota archaeon]|nr:50S ribosomal protein L15e [Candidatus Woesearchaeota archaeon]HIH47825.1 50S ribosomal protein L15e [Candidatus Woesearchaeota archaeon]
MGYLKYMRESWKNPSETVEALWRQRMILWRQEPVTLRIEHPTRIDRARSLGYKAKPGFIIVRQRVGAGGHNRSTIRRKGRRPKHARRFTVLSKTYQIIAEQRAVQDYVNCEVLNSYFVGKDGKNYWYEVILVDKNHPAILADPQMRWIHEKQHTGRIWRGLTASGKRSRGILTNKGKGAEKLRPSMRAHDRLAK